MLGWWRKMVAGMEGMVPGLRDGREPEDHKGLGWMP